MIAENVKKKIDEYWMEGFFQYQPNNVIELKCDSAERWLNNDMFYRNIVAGCSWTEEKITFLLTGGRYDLIDKVKSALFNRVIINLTSFIDSVSYKPSPRFEVMDTIAPVVSIVETPVIQQEPEAVEIQDEVSINPTTKKKKEKNL